MKVEVLVIEDCPHAAAATELIETALRRTGRADTAVTTTIVTEDSVATAKGFGGSPTFLIDGVDAFPSSQVNTAVTCRVYSTSNGMQGLPDLADLLDRISGSG